jgi:hypothetical protein
MVFDNGSQLSLPSFRGIAIFGAGAISGREARINTGLSSMTDESRLRVFIDAIW